MAPRALAVRQDLFDVTACYFPISFTPPRNDPHAISVDELRTSLRYVRPRVVHGVVSFYSSIAPTWRGQRGRIYLAGMPCSQRQRSGRS